MYRMFTEVLVTRVVFLDHKKAYNFVACESLEAHYVIRVSTQFLHRVFIMSTLGLSQRKL